MTFGFFDLLPRSAFAFRAGFALRRNCQTCPSPTRSRREDVVLRLPTRFAGHPHCSTMWEKSGSLWARRTARHPPRSSGTGRCARGSAPPRTCDTRRKRRLDGCVHVVWGLTSLSAPRLSTFNGSRDKHPILLSLDETHGSCPPGRMAPLACGEAATAGAVPGSESTGTLNLTMRLLAYLRHACPKLTGRSGCSNPASPSPASQRVSRSRRPERSRYQSAAIQGWRQSASRTPE